MIWSQFHPYSVYILDRHQLRLAFGNGLRGVMQRHGICRSQGVKAHELRIADWARVEQRHKIWAQWRDEFFVHVRGIFVLLLFATIVVFVYNHLVAVQSAASTGVHQVANKITVSDKLREQALNHEKQVDQINQQ